jgi:hypothetical protein
MLIRVKWIYLGVGILEGLDDFNNRDHIIEFSEELPQWYSFTTRRIWWYYTGNNHYHPATEQQTNPSLDKEPNKLRLTWRIHKGLTSCKMIDTSLWTKDNFPENGDWLFLSAKKLISSMKIPSILQILLSETTTNNNNYDREAKSY